jgi:hypothetical protein
MICYDMKFTAIAGVLCAVLLVACEKGQIADPVALTPLREANASTVKSDAAATPK